MIIFPFIPIAPVDQPSEVSTTDSASIDAKVPGSETHLAVKLLWKVPKFLAVGRGSSSGGSVKYSPTVALVPSRVGSFTSKLSFGSFTSLAIAVTPDSEDDLTTFVPLDTGPDAGAFLFSGQLFILVCLSPFA